MVLNANFRCVGSWENTLAYSYCPKVSKKKKVYKIDTLVAHNDKKLIATKKR